MVALAAMLLHCGAATWAADAATQGAAAEFNPPTAPAGNPTIESAIAQLDSPKYAIRDWAQHFLMRQSPDDLPTIEKALESATDAETVMRLNYVAAHLFLKGRTQFDGRASLLGISLGIESAHLGQPNGDGRVVVAVTDLQPGFPAAEVLRPGDRILAINSEPLPSDTTVESFRQHVNAALPGTVMRLQILRGREQSQVSVRLAGVPEEGAEAIQNFVRLRLAAAKGYLESIRSTHESPVIIHTSEENDAPPIPAPD
jgi:C-terminal processing protease CtpA/Prc